MKTCKNCGKLLEKINKHSFCIECRTFTCISCGKVFIVNKSQHAKHAKYCSKECLYKTREYEHTCKKCNKTFLSKSSTAEYCNYCKTITCSVCGKLVKVTHYELGTRKFCSKKCHDYDQLNHKWSEVELSFIANNYPYKISLKELSEKFDSSISSIRRVIVKLNLPKCPVELRSQRQSNSSQIWTKEKIVKTIQFLYESGVNLNSSNIQKNYGSLLNSAYSRFGNWQQAIEASGYNYNSINLHSSRKTWSYDDIILKIKELYQAGENLMASAVRDNNADLFNAARRNIELGTWELAINAAGLNYNIICGEKWGNRYQSINGIFYDSIIEGRVADRLYQLKEDNIISEFESHVKICNKRRWTCDFVITINKSQKLWLEVDGLEESRKDGVYGPTHEKIQYYIKNKYNYKIITRIEQVDEILFLD